MTRADHDEQPGVVFVNARCIGAIWNSLLIRLPDQDPDVPSTLQVPRKCIQDDSQVKEVGDEGELTVAKWWLEKQDWYEAVLKAMARDAGAVK